MTHSTNDTLSFTTYLNEQGNPDSYLVEGMLTDEDGQVFPVGEFCFYFDKALKNLCYYVDNFNFDHNRIQYIVK